MTIPYEVSVSLKDFAIKVLQNNALDVEVKEEIVGDFLGNSTKKVSHFKVSFRGDGTAYTGVLLFYMHNMRIPAYNIKISVTKNYSGDSKHKFIVADNIAETREVFAYVSAPLEILSLFKLLDIPTTGDIQKAKEQIFSIDDLEKALQQPFSVKEIDMETHYIPELMKVYYPEQNEK